MSDAGTNDPAVSEGAIPMHAHPVPRSTRPVVRTSLAVLAAGALLLGACGDDDDDAAEEPTTTAPTTAAEEHEAVASSPSGELALVGTWAVPNGREQTFTADGEFFVTADGEVLAEGTYEATPTTIELTPGSGPIACAEPGTYEWEVQDDTLTFTAIDDHCTGRKEGLDGVPRTRAEPASQNDARTLPQGESEVSAGDTLVTPNLGGLRFVVPEDRTVYQAPGLVSIENRNLGTSIDFVLVVETLDGEPIDSVDTVVSLIDETTVTLDEAAPTTIAGHEARVFDFTAAPERQPRPEFAVFRFEEGGVGGWGPVGESRVWLLDTPQGILLLGAGADVIAEAETIFATLELVDVGS
jgi:hypothetical protein